QVSFGGVAERSIAPVLKTGNPKGFVGSNPTPSARRTRAGCAARIRFARVRRVRLFRCKTFPMRAAETNQPRHSIVRKVILVLAIAMMMLAAIATITYRSTRTFIDTAERVGRSREIIGRERSLLRHLTEAESGARGYIISGDELYLRPYEDARTRIIQDFNALKDLSTGKRSQSVR